MKYYLTQYILRKAITGTICQTMPGPSNPKLGWYEDVKNYTQIQRNAFPEFVPKVNIELEEGAKYTDVVKISNCDVKGFLVSNRFKDILSEYHVFDHRYYQAKLKHYDGEEKSYLLFHMAAHDLTGIDWNRTIFLDGNNDGAQIKAPSMLATRTLEKYNYLIKHKLFFNQDFPDYDLFYLPYYMVDEDFFISERLVERLNKEKITGLKYIEQDFIEEW